MSLNSIICCLEEHASTDVVQAILKDSIKENREYFAMAVDKQILQHAARHERSTSHLRSPQETCYSAKLKLIERKSSYTN